MGWWWWWWCSRTAGGSGCPRPPPPRPAPPPRRAAGLPRQQTLGGQRRSLSVATFGTKCCARSALTAVVHGAGAQQQPARRARILPNTLLLDHGTESKMQQASCNSGSDRRQQQVAVTSVSSRSRAPRAGPSSAAPRGRTRRWAARSSASGRSAPRRMRRRPPSCPGTAAGCEQSADPTRRCPGLSAATLCVRLPAAAKS